ncbi:MAG TPA: hypothetical protein VNA28_16650 [Solirubrobacteraceae bacterium]|nr:hypothetical protein [Solirubrobacteraceae bacterium]
MKQSARAAGGDRAPSEPQVAQLSERDHGVLLGRDRSDQPIGMLERYLRALARDRDGSSITQVIERYRCR